MHAEEVTDSVVDKVSIALRDVPGIQAVVLGGSRARGNQSIGSDIDIGVYYSSDAPLDLAVLSEVAQQLDDEHREGLIASPGEWGNWVNGGAWLVINTLRVDLILRDIRRVENDYQ